MRISDGSSDVCSSDLRPGSADSSRITSGTLPTVLLPTRAAPPSSRVSSKETPASCSRAMSPALKPVAPSAPVTTKRSEEHTSELQSLMRISYAVFCLKKKKTKKLSHDYTHQTTNQTKP